MLHIWSFGFVKIGLIVWPEIHENCSSESAPSFGIFVNFCKLRSNALFDWLALKRR